MKRNFVPGMILFMGFVVLSCHSNDIDKTLVSEITESATPVTVTSVRNGSLQQFIELNATAVFQQKWMVKSTLTGYLQQSFLQLNKFVSKAELLVTIKTKEAASIGNTINMLDSSFKFSGVNAIRANGNGFVSEINRQQGDYVQEGEQIAVITDTKSFVFLLDMPYEMRSLIIDKNNIQVILPDGEILQAFIFAETPIIDVSSQTQRMILKVHATHLIPENLIAKVRLIRTNENHALYLPKASILTNEAQDAFWVMRLLNDSTAVKAIIRKGIETNDNTEILFPLFSERDKILLTGNYGLNDTAKVKVIAP